LGNPTSHSPDDARAEARRTREKAAAGVDPPAEKKAWLPMTGEIGVRHFNLFRTVTLKTLPRGQYKRDAGLPFSGYVAGELAQVKFARIDMTVGLPATDQIEAEERRMLGGAMVALTVTRALRCLLLLPGLVPGRWAYPGQPMRLSASLRRPKALHARSHRLTSPNSLSFGPPPTGYARSSQLGEALVNRGEY